MNFLVLKLSFGGNYRLSHQTYQVPFKPAWLHVQSELRRVHSAEQTLTEALMAVLVRSWTDDAEFWFHLKGGEHLEISFDFWLTAGKEDEAQKFFIHWDWWGGLHMQSTSHLIFWAPCLLLIQMQAMMVPPPPAPQQDGLCRIKNECSWSSDGLLLSLSYVGSMRAAWRKMD